MRKSILNLTLAAVAVCGLMLGSCKKDSTTSSSTNQTLTAGKAEIRFSYSGAASGSFQSDLLTSLAASNGGYANISGSTISTNPDMAMILSPVTGTGISSQSGPGTDLPNGFTLTFNKGMTGNQAWTVGGGTATGFSVNITKNSGGEIEGTFSGELGTDANSTKITLTNGYFHAKF